MDCQRILNGDYLVMINYNFVLFKCLFQTTSVKTYRSKKGIQGQVLGNVLAIWTIPVQLHSERQS